MQKIRTRRFHLVLRLSLCFSVLFLGFLLLFGKQLAMHNFALMTDCVFAVMMSATASFLAVCFAPYFRGDKRWFAIPALLTVLFFVSTVVLWQLPLPAVVA